MAKRMAHGVLLLKRFRASYFKLMKGGRVGRGHTGRCGYNQISTLTLLFFVFSWSF